MKKVVLGLCILGLFSCGKKEVKVVPQKPKVTEEQKFQQELSKLREQLRKDYEEFLTKAYQIQEGTAWN